MSKINFDFTGENYVVTGASSGMGRQVALELAQAGAKVLAIARREDKLLELQAECAEQIFVAPLDVCDRDKLENAIKVFVEVHGKVSGGIHAAGITNITPIKSYNRIQASEIMNINFWAGMDFLQIITKRKFSNEKSSFVLFSSVGAQYSPKGMFVYGASKAAVDSAIRSISKEIAKRGQRVNTVMPGWVETGMTDKLGLISNTSEILANEILGIGFPEDVSGMVLFLLSNRARWITGTSIAVDGGFLA